NRYRGRVWLAAAEGSEPPRPFTAGEHRDGRPRWSPDGRELAFVSHREGEGSELYVLPVTGGGELRRAASWPEEIEELAWSPDGSRPPGRPSAARPGRPTARRSRSCGVTPARSRAARRSARWIATAATIDCSRRPSTATVHPSWSPLANRCGTARISSSRSRT